MSGLRSDQICFPGHALHLCTHSRCWARLRPTSSPPSCLSQRNRTKFDFYSPNIFNAVQNEMINLPYLSLLTLPQTLYDLGDPLEERLNRSRQALDDIASEAEDDVLRKMNFLSTSLCSAWRDSEGRAGVCFVQYTPSRPGETPPPEAMEGPVESPSSTQLTHTLPALASGG